MLHPLVPGSRAGLGGCTIEGLCSRKVSGLTPTAVFALATPKSPIDRGGRWQLQFYLYCKFFYFFVLLSDTHQGRVWNQTTQPELFCTTHPLSHTCS
jgi:hypothetical protein